MTTKKIKPVIHWLHEHVWYSNPTQKERIHSSPVVAWGQLHLQQPSPFTSYVGEFHPLPTVKPIFKPPLWSVAPTPPWPIVKHGTDICHGTHITAVWSETKIHICHPPECMLVFVKLHTKLQLFSFDNETTCNSHALFWRSFVSPTGEIVDDGNGVPQVCVWNTFCVAVVIAPKLVKRVDWIFSGFSEDFEWNNFLNRGPGIFWSIAVQGCVQTQHHPWHLGAALFALIFWAPNSI